MKTPKGKKAGRPAKRRGYGVESTLTVTAVRRLENEGPYAERRDALTELGFSSYNAYLRSGLWARIRAAVLAAYPLCPACRRARPRQVHHMSYALGVMRGNDRSKLVPLCRKCHRRVEFNGRLKRSFPRAQAKCLRLLAKARAAGPLRSAPDRRAAQLRLF